MDLSGWEDWPDEESNRLRFWNWQVLWQLFRCLACFFCEFQTLFWHKSQGFWVVEGVLSLGGASQWLIWLVLVVGKWCLAGWWVRLCGKNSSPAHFPWLCFLLYYIALMARLKMIGWDISKVCVWYTRLSWSGGIHRSKSFDFSWSVCLGCLSDPADSLAGLYWYLQSLNFLGATVVILLDFNNAWESRSSLSSAFW